MNKTVLNISGMGCSRCEKKVEEACMKVEGVKGASASFKNGNVTIKHEGDLNIVEIVNNITEEGYDVTE